MDNIYILPLPLYSMTLRHRAEWERMMECTSPQDDSIWPRQAVSLDHPYMLTSTHDFKHTVTFIYIQFDLPVLLS